MCGCLCLGAVVGGFKTCGFLVLLTCFKRAIAGPVCIHIVQPQKEDSCLFFGHSLSVLLLLCQPHTCASIRLTLSVDSLPLFLQPSYDFLWPNFNTTFQPSSPGLDNQVGQLSCTFFALC